MYLNYINFDNDPAYQQGYELGFRIGSFIGGHWLLIAVALLILGSILFFIRRSRRKNLQKLAKPVN
jgi:uncharacterized membrane protein